jgi:hypothetical protein
MVENTRNLFRRKTEGIGLLKMELKKSWTGRSRQPSRRRAERYSSAKFPHLSLATLI